MLASGWGWSFVVPGFIMAGVAILIYLFLVVCKLLCPAPPRPALLFNGVWPSPHASCWDGVDPQDLGLEDPLSPEV
jgi:hypothetical protein